MTTATQETPAELSLNSQGTIAERLAMAGGNISELRPLGLVPENVWREYDTAVQLVAQERFSLIADLHANNLVYDISSNPLARSEIRTTLVSDMSPAQLSMDADVNDVQDLPNFSYFSIPVPIAHKGFKVSIRDIKESESTRAPIDTTAAQVATRKVVELLEQTAINGSYNVGASRAGSLYGLTTFPQRNVYALTAAWPSASPAQILTDVRAMIQLAMNDFMYGPYMLYVPTTYWDVLNSDYDTTTATGRTVKRRIVEMDEIIDVKTNYYLTGNNVVLVQFTSDVIDVVNGIQPTMVQWNENGGMSSLHKIISIMPVRLKHDANGNCGIVHGVI